MNSLQAIGAGGVVATAAVAFYRFFSGLEVPIVYHALIIIFGAVLLAGIIKEDWNKKKGFDEELNLEENDDELQDD